MTILLRMFAVSRLRLHLPNMPIAEPCPKCGAPFIVEKQSQDRQSAYMRQRRLRLGKAGPRGRETQRQWKKRTVPVKV